MSTQLYLTPHPVFIARTELYSILTERYDFLGQIQSNRDSSAHNENGRLQQLSLKSLSEADCFALFSEVEHRLPISLVLFTEISKNCPDHSITLQDSKAALMLASAATHEASFREAVASLAFAFNKAETTADICAKFELDPSAFPLELRAADLKLVEGSSDLVVGRFAGIREVCDRLILV